MKIKTQLLAFRSTIFLSAFLLFSVQPMIAKILLPWFGGSTTVWTISLVFFTSSLLLGYLYAHVIGGLKPRTQLVVHTVFMIVTIGLLITLWNAWGSPITPSLFFKPNPTAPIRSLFGLLFLTIGIPYFLLAATTPLIQSWFHKTFHGAPYKLYSVSNIGSLGALLCYPIIIEPFLDVSTQGRIWAICFFVFTLLLFTCGWAFMMAVHAQTKSVVNKESSSKQEIFYWIVLSAIPAFFLVTVTNTITQGVASAPFLWVLPLALYLLTFIIVFDDFEMPSYMLGGSLIFSSALAMFVLQNQLSATVTNLTGVLAALLFFVCLYFHQWLFETRPLPTRLTTYYVYLSLGGALGTIIASLVVPLVFVKSIELLVAVLIVFYFAVHRLFNTVDLFKTKSVLRRLFMTLLFISFVLVVYKQINQNPDIIFETRNFYGSISVSQKSVGDDQVRLLMNGRILHGLQVITSDQSSTPSTYYAESSGIGQQIRFMQEQRSSNRFGLVGLGSGTLAAYCKDGDKYQFFEIDPDVVSIAYNQFTFLSHCSGSSVVLGDARLSLEQEQTEQKERFNLLAIDAFTDDSIPVHLLTSEALDLYLDRLNTDGVIAFHVSNRFLDLVSVLKGLAQSHELHGVVVRDTNKTDVYKCESVWVLLSKNTSSLKDVFDGDVRRIEDIEKTVYWIDAFSNLLSVVRW